MRAGWRAGVAGAFGVLLLWAAPVPVFAAGSPHSGKAPPGQARKAARLAQAPVITTAALPPPATPAPPSARPAPLPAATSLPQPVPSAAPKIAPIAPPVAPLPAAPTVVVAPVAPPPASVAPVPLPTPAPVASVEVRTVVRTVTVTPGWLPAFLIALLGGLLLLALTLVVTVRAHMASRRHFLDVASHDMRTPLSVIQGYVAMAQEGMLGDVPPALAEALPIMGARAAELERTIRKLLDEAGKGELDPD